MAPSCCFFAGCPVLPARRVCACVCCVLPPPRTGRGYFGFEQGDTSLRAELYKMREREKREAERRAAIEREELAKLGDTRKK